MIQTFVNAWKVPELRKKMLGNRFANRIGELMKRLADAGITLCGQIVLCRGVNDGAELKRSLTDLAALYPAMSSVAIVPAGLTKFRDKLYPLTDFSPEEARDVIALIDSVGEKMLREHGSRMFFAADEFYLGQKLKKEIGIVEHVFSDDVSPSFYRGAENVLYRGMECYRERLALVVALSLAEGSEVGNAGKCIVFKGQAEDLVKQLARLEGLRVYRDDAG